MDTNLPEKEIMDKLKEKFFQKLEYLNETVWEGKISEKRINDWLNNFNGNKEELNATYLLTVFMYFGNMQMKQLLKALYRDLIKYPIIEKIRLLNQDTMDQEFINSDYRRELNLSRFLGIGNPSESGPHLLYYFRQENDLSKYLFINEFELFKNDEQNNRLLRNESLKRLVFIDDFAASGSQAISYANSGNLNLIKSLNKNIEVIYLTLFATNKALDKIRSETSFSVVDSLIILDESYKVFHRNSRYFKNNDPLIDINFTKSFCQKYGEKLMRKICEIEGYPYKHVEECAKKHALGFKDGQLLLSFFHNTPDNTLPIIWFSEKYEIWNPIFKRYNKKFGET